MTSVLRMMNATHLAYSLVTNLVAWNYFLAMMTPTWQINFSAVTLSALQMMMVYWLVAKYSLLFFIPFHFFIDPFAVAFVQTTYTVVESEGPVEVCVNLTRPPVDILEETVRVRVINDEGSIYIPPGVRLASESQLTVCIVLMMTLCILSPAPDMPDFLSRYLMPEGTDYAEQTFGVNAINDQLINATRRMICYDQPIYDDEHLEVSEYAGLTLDVDDNILFTTVLTEVQELYDFVSIRILDDDSEFSCSSLIVIHPLNLCLARVQGLEWVWRGHSIVSQRVWVWWSCVLLYTSPTSPVPLSFHSTLASPLLMELQV